MHAARKFWLELRLMPGSRGALAAPPHALPGLPPRLLAPAHANRLRFSLIRALPPPQPRLPPRYRARAVALEASPNARTTTPPGPTPRPPRARSLLRSLSRPPPTVSLTRSLQRPAAMLIASPPCRRVATPAAACAHRARPHAAARAASPPRALLHSAAAAPLRTPPPDLAAHALPAAAFFTAASRTANLSTAPLPPCGRFASAFGRGSAAVSVSPAGANPAAPSTSSFQQQLSHRRRRSVGVSELSPLITG